MSALVINGDGAERLLADVRLYGARPAETGAFLLSEADRPQRLEIVALAGDRGVDRTRDLFSVSGESVERLFTWAAENELQIRAQVHSHRKQAFLSPTDLRDGFNVAGFVSCVIPNYDAPPVDPEDWGWWEYRAGHWRLRSAPTVVPGGVYLVRFDAEGVK